ncbi:MAG TPA: toll/interleukin-1 receptor domain-containing protein [Chloroflexia bacterium]|jgi:hypothetical protein
MDVKDKSKGFDVFLSYSHPDQDWATSLAQALSRQGVSVWTDSMIKLGDSLIDSIETAMEQSKYIVLLVSPNSTRSSWAAFELGAALGMGKSVVPVVSAQVSTDDLAGPIRSRKFLREDDPETIASQIASVVLHQDESYMSNGA